MSCVEQMADEMTLGAEVKDKGRGNAAKQSSRWVRGERVPSEASSWRFNSTPEFIEAGAQRSRERDTSSPPMFSLEMYLKRVSSAASSSTDSLPLSQQSNMGVDCAGIVLNCLFCRFYDIVLMLPESCERVAHNCCPNYRQVDESLPSNDDDSHIDWDCGLLSACQDGSDCLELAMEVSEICYH